MNIDINPAVNARVWTEEDIALLLAKQKVLNDKIRKLRGEILELYVSIVNSEVKDLETIVDKFDAWLDELEK